MIKIIVGEGEEQQSFNIQERVFTRTSEVFAAHIRNEHLGASPKGELRFPDDPVDVWQLLIYWMVEGQLPPECNDEKESAEPQLVLIRGWILGDKYDIPQFQNEVMLALLWVLENATTMSPESAAVAAAGSLPLSKLHKLVCHQIVRVVYVKKERDVEEFERATAVIGLAAELVSKLDMFHTDFVSGADFVSGYLERGGFSRDLWRKYMIGDGSRPCSALGPQDESRGEGGAILRHWR